MLTLPLMRMPVLDPIESPKESPRASVTPPPTLAAPAGCASPTSKTVCFAPTRTVVYFSRQLDESKIPSDAIAPLGLGEPLGCTDEPLAEAEHSRSLYNYIVPVPPGERMALLAGTCTSEAMAAAVQQNVQLLRELSDSRMQLIRSGKRSLSAADLADSDDDESDMATEAPAKRQRSSSSSSSSDDGGRRHAHGGKCDGCRRVVCLCIEA